MTRILSISFAVLGSMIATGTAGVILAQQANIPGSSIFPMPFLVIFEWGALSMSGAVFVILAEVQSDERHLKGAWAIIGAYIPLVLLGAFSFGPYALINALLLLGAALLVTRHRRLAINALGGSIALGALINLAILLGLIGVNALVQ